MFGHLRWAEVTATVPSRPPRRRGRRSCRRGRRPTRALRQPSQCGKSRPSPARAPRRAGARRGLAEAGTSTKGGHSNSNSNNSRRPVSARPRRASRARRARRRRPMRLPSRSARAAESFTGGRVPTMRGTPFQPARRPQRSECGRRIRTLAGEAGVEAPVLAEEHISRSQDSGCPRRGRTTRGTVTL